MQRYLPKASWVAATLLALCGFGCRASVDGAGPAGGGSSAGGSAGLGGGVPLPPGTDAAALLPARIRRLTVAEYDASVSDVLGQTLVQANPYDFVPDSRQGGGFTVNEAQRVDPVLARQLSDAATKFAAAFRASTPPASQCPNAATDPSGCATSFIKSFGERTYRRPVGDDEVTQLLTVFQAGLDGGSYDEGIELVVRAMLQSAAFLYLTEIGDAPAATIRLTGPELASAISYLALGKPPSDALRQQAASGELDTPEGRAKLTDTLFTQPGADQRVPRIFGEWLGTDKIADTSKDSNQFAEFAAAKLEMQQESALFLASLVEGDNKGGHLHDLLAADWTFTNQHLATVYGVTGGTDSTFVKTPVPGRLGILNQGAFLSVYAHATETAPVLRGVAVLRRVACVEVGDPTELGISVVPPVPDKMKTTRQRFEVHSVPGCASCHNLIDSFGFAFEGFDAMGAPRPGGMENGQAVDTTTTIAGTDFDGPYPDSNALVKAMSTSNQVAECYARHMFRAMAGTSSQDVRPSEDDFVKYWRTTQSTDGSGKVTDTNLIGTLAAYINSPSFAYRRAQ